MKKLAIFFVCFCVGLCGYYLYSSVTNMRFGISPLEFKMDGKFNGVPKILVNGEPSFTTYDGVEALSMNVLYPNTIQIGNTVQKVKIDTLQKDQYIPLQLRYADQTVFVKLYTVPQNMPQYKIEKTSDSYISDGYVLTSFHTLMLNQSSYIVIINGQGDLVYYRGTNHPKTTTFHFQKFNVDDKTLFSHHIQTEPSLTGAWILGDNVVMDDKFNVIDTVHILSTDRHPEMPADQHDFVILGENHYLLVGYWNEKYQLSDGTSKTLVSAIVQEQKDGKVLFDWVSSDYPITFDMCIEKCPTSDHKIADYVHINTVSVDPKDNNLILSLASPYAVVKINRVSGDVMWILSGEKDEFNVPSQYKLTRQHDAYMENGELVVFDNAYSSLANDEVEQHAAFFKQQTGRMLRFKLDEVNKKVLSVSEVPLNEQARYMGSAQRLDDNLIFFGCGSSAECAAKAVKWDGSEVWKMTVQQPYTTYRAYWMDKIN